MLRKVAMLCALTSLRVCGGGDPDVVVEVVDLTHPTTVHAVADYYGAMEKRWKLCNNCGVPTLGTTMHLEQGGAGGGAMYPALIPAEYLLTRLVIIDASTLARLQPALVLSLEVALQWSVLRRDPTEPTLLLFRFGAHASPPSPPDPAAAPAAAASPHLASHSCVCKVPGISFELAEWIASNLTHVVGVATDAATLESEQSREFNTKTVASILARSGLYMIEHVNMRRRLPERGCMAVAMPLKLQNANYVPSRLIAFCPSDAAGARGLGGVGGVGVRAGEGARGGGGGGGRGAGSGGEPQPSSAPHVVLSLLPAPRAPSLYPSRNNDVALDDIMN